MYPLYPNMLHPNYVLFDKVFFFILWVSCNGRSYRLTQISCLQSANQIAITSFGQGRLEATKIVPSMTSTHLIHKKHYRIGFPIRILYYFSISYNTSYWLIYFYWFISMKHFFIFFLQLFLLPSLQTSFCWLSNCQNFALIFLHLLMLFQNYIYRPRNCLLFNTSLHKEVTTHINQNWLK